MARTRLLRGLALALFCGLAAVSCGDGEDVTRGPYLQSVTADSVVVRWRTDRPTGSSVHYGPAPNQLNDQVTGTGDPTTEHELRLTGLAPDQRYYYAPGDGKAALAAGSPLSYFHTAPAVGATRPIRVWALGDGGRGTKKAKAVRKGYKTYVGTREADLWLLLGDNAYPDGTDEQFQVALFDNHPALLRRTVLWPAFGNHDGHSARAADQSGPYFDSFTLPRQGEAGGRPSGTEAYYAFDYGNVHFISLDSYESDRAPDGAMAQWLEADLAASDQQWIIAYWHHPPYSKGSHDSDLEIELIEMRENILPILERHGVDLVLTGHSHSYERSPLINGHYGPSGDLRRETMILDPGDGQPDGDGAYVKPAAIKAANSGTVYLVAGTGANLRKEVPLDHPVMAVNLKTLGSVILDIEGPRLDGAFIDRDGQIQDSFRIEKRD